MDAKNYIPFRRTLLLSLLALILPALSILSVTVYYQASTQIRSDFRLLRQQTERNLDHLIRVTDTSYQMLERSLDDQMRHAFKGFLKAYEEADREISRMDLEAIQESMGIPVDLYIIDESGIITATTYEPDLGVDFSQFPGFYREITEYRLGNEYKGDRLSQEMSSGIIRRYAYHPTPDHRYLFELGLRSEAFKLYMGQLTPETYAEELKALNPALQEIQFIAENEDGSGTLADISVPLDQRPLAPNQEVVQEIFRDPDHGRRRLIDPETGDFVQFFYVSLEEEEATTRNRLVRMVYDRSIEEQAVGRILEQLLGISILIILVTVLFAYLLALRVSDPIHRIVEEVNQIASGELHHKINERSRNELIILEKSINKMKETILSYMERYKDSENQLREHNEHLEELVEERSRQLAESEKMAAVSHLVIGVAHEINTPVGVSFTAASYLQKLQEEMTGKIHGASLTLQDMETFLRKSGESNALIQRNLQQTADLVKRFKEISIAAGRDSEKATLRTADFLRTLLATRTASLTQKGFMLSLEVPEDLFLRTYTQGLSQAISQLIQNSMDFMSPEEKNPQLQIICLPKDDGALFILEDNGPGVPESLEQRIFEPFFTSDRGHHTGLGLHIVYNTVTQQLRGSISLGKSSLGGTLFSLFVPNLGDDEKRDSIH